MIGQCHDDVTSVDQSALSYERGKSKHAANLFLSPLPFPCKRNAVWEVVHHFRAKNYLNSPRYSIEKAMEGCISTVQVTPPVENEPAFTQHILWAPKKKRSHRRVISDIPSGARVNTHSKIRKRLIFPCLEDGERKEKEEAPKNMPECDKVLNIGEKNSARTPNCSEGKRNGSGVQLDLSKATNVRVGNLKVNQKGVKNADPQRIKRKLALSSFR